MAAVQRRNQEHADYVVAVCRALLDWAVERGDIAPVDTASVARTLATLGQDYIRPDVLPTLASSPKAAADEMVEIILRGLPRPPSTPRSGGTSRRQATQIAARSRGKHTGRTDDGTA
jgi:hypothetical protein